MRSGTSLLAGVLTLILCAAGCSSVQPPVLDHAVIAMTERPAVVYVSGITGSFLYDKQEDRLTWGDIRSFFFPRDLGYATARPLGTAADRIEARGPITEVRVRSLYRKEIYRPILTTFEANRYRTGADLILFGYDWRQSNVESARELARRIDEVGGRRPVVLICQSNGGYLCRWAVRFGDVSLQEAERGVVRRPRATVTALILLGTANAGSARILREIDRGRTYVKFGRFFSPEVFFTYPSLYQDLPPWRDDLFVDEKGRLIDVDLLDASTWERYGWAIFGREAKARADARADLFADRETRLAFLGRQLDEAGRFHAVLRDGPAPPPSIRYYSIQNRSHRTINRAMLVERNGTWKTLFIGDERVDSRPELQPLMATMGDLHASVESQEALPAVEKASLAEPVIEVDGDHLGVIRSPASHRAILRIIATTGREMQEPKR